MISDLYINPNLLSFFKIFFRTWENAARLFFNFSDVIFATLVKFCFIGFYNILLMLVSIEFNSRLIKNI